MHEQWSARTAAKDLDGLMEHIAPDVVSYEQAGRLQYTGIGEVREVCRRGLESSPGRIDFDVPDLTVHADGDLAVAWGLDRITADGAESVHCRRRKDGHECILNGRELLVERHQDCAALQIFRPALLEWLESDEDDGSIRLRSEVRDRQSRKFDGVFDAWCL